MEVCCLFPRQPQFALRLLLSSKSYLISHHHDNKRKFGAINTSSLSSYRCTHCLFINSAGWKSITDRWCCNRESPSALELRREFHQRLSPSLISHLRLISESYFKFANAPEREKQQSLIGCSHVLMIGVKTMEPFQFAFDSIGEAGSPPRATKCLLAK